MRAVAVSEGDCGPQQSADQIGPPRVGAIYTCLKGCQLLHVVDDPGRQTGTTCVGAVDKSAEAARVDAPLLGSPVDDRSCVGGRDTDKRYFSADARHRRCRGAGAKGEVYLRSDGAEGQNCWRGSGQWSERARWMHRDRRPRLPAVRARRVIRPTPSSIGLRDQSEAWSRQRRPCRGGGEPQAGAGAGRGEGSWGGLAEWRPPTVTFDCV